MQLIAQGTGRYKPTHFKNNRAATVNATYNNGSGTAAVQQHQRFKLWPFVTVFCVRMCVQCSPGDTCYHEHTSTYAFKIKKHVVEPHPVKQHTATVGVNRDA